MDPIKEFESKRKKNIKGLSKDAGLKDMTAKWMMAAGQYQYSYNYTWMGRPLVQFPQDMIAMQELIWKIKPDLIIETGVAHGGSLIYYASLLEMMQIPNSKVLGIDIDIREHNRKAIEKHQMAHKIELIEGSSILKSTLKKVTAVSKKHSRVMVLFDSNHTHVHVLAELKLYTPLVTKGSYCVVFDTVIEDRPADFKWNRPWGKGNNPKTAVHEFMKGNSNFVIDRSTEDKLLITVCPDGFLKRIK